MNNQQQIEKEQRVEEYLEGYGSRSQGYEPISTVRLKEKYKTLWLTPEMAEMQLKARPRLREPIVRFEQFVLDENYLGLDGDVYEAILAIGGKITRMENCREVVVLAGIGSGKSFLSNLLTAYDAYCILCLKDPHSYYKLSKDKPITMMNMGLSAGQAKKVVFSGLKSIILQSKWFRNALFNPRDDVNSVRILFKRPVGTGPRGRIVTQDILAIESGNSAETTPIGMNLISMTLDEAAFYQDSEGNNQAEDIYFAGQSRIQSRFGAKAGRMIIISSPRYEKDFINQKFQESQQHRDVMFGISLPTRRAKDRRKLSDEVFVFDTDKLTLYKDKERCEKVPEVGLTDEQRKKLKFGDTALDNAYWIIPMDYRDAFNRSPEKSMRDLGARPTDTIEAFFKIREHITRAMSKGRKNRVLEGGVWDTSNPPLEPVYIHIDIGMNRNGKGDCAGMAVCRCTGYTEEDKRPIIVYDFVDQIHAGATNEVQIEDLRERIFQLQRSGRKIGRVTLDSFQSFDTVQILNSRGIRTENLSVDVSPQPYESLREGLRADTVWLPEHEVLARELRELERVKGAKVDHPPKGSKDVADAVAGSYFSCITDLTEAYATARTTKISIHR